MTFTTTHHHARDPDTSVQAARGAQGLAERHKAVIITILVFWGEVDSTREGLTSQEIADYCELDYLQVARRISDLKRDKRVVDSGERRRSPGGRTACVWRLV